MSAWAFRRGRCRLGHAQEDQETFDRGAGLRPLSPAVAVVGTRPGGALACRPERTRGGPALGPPRLDGSKRPAFRAEQGPRSRRRDAGTATKAGPQLRERLKQRGPDRAPNPNLVLARRSRGP